MYLQGKKLVKVIVVAKSKMGRGSMALTTGNKETVSKIVTGFPEDFFDSAAYTYDRIRFKPAKYGAWNGGSGHGRSGYGGSGYGGSGYGGRGYGGSASFQNDAFNAGQQKWQVKIQGLVKIKKIILIVANK